MKKFMLRVMPIVLVALVMLSGWTYAIDPVEPPKGNEIKGLTGVASDFWTTFASIVQILAVVAVVIAGVRYMFASADTKADIKQQTIILVVGAVLVFAAVPILQFVQKIANDIF